MLKLRRFVVGGTLDPKDALYIRRPADDELLGCCRRAEFCFVLASRQVGKSSLMASTANALGKDGIASVMIDLTSIGTIEITADQWYLGFIYEIQTEFVLETDSMEWWTKHAYLPIAQRFADWFQEVLLREVQSPIVIFVDEIDSTLNLTFTDDFFATIRSFWNLRASKAIFSRLSFVLLGVATPGALIRDPTRTPFNVGVQIELSDFDCEQAKPLVSALGLSGQKAERVLRRVLYWTGGHPYLTQKLCNLMTEKDTTAEAVDRIVADDMIGDRARAEVHYQYIASMINDAPPRELGLVYEEYEKALRNKGTVRVDQSPVHIRLRLSGLVKPQGRVLTIRNEIYRRVFDKKWVRLNRPTFWTQANKRLVALAVLAVAAMFVMVTVNDMLQRALEQSVASKALMQGWVILDGQKTESTELAFLLSAAAFRVKPDSDAYASLQFAISSTRGISRISHISNELVTTSPNGRFAVTIRDRHLTLWYLDRGKPPAKLDGHSGAVSAIAFSDDSRTLVSGDEIGEIRVWDMSNNGRPIASPLHTRSVISSLAVSPDRKLIASGTVKGVLQLWKIGDGTISGAGLLSERDTATDRDEAHGASESAITRIAFVSSDSFVSSGQDGTLRLWDTGNPDRALVLRNSDNQVSITSFAVRPDRNLIASGGQDGTLTLWNLATGSSKTVQGDASAVTSVAFSPDGQSLITGSISGTLSRWDLETLSLQGQQLGENRWGITTVVFGDDRQSFISANKHGTLLWWSADDSLRSRSVPTQGQLGGATTFAFDPAGTSLVAGIKGASLRIWDAATRKPRGNPPDVPSKSVASVAFSPDGSQLVVGLVDGTLQYWDAVTGQRQGAIVDTHGGRVRALAFSPDKSVLVTVDDPNRLHWWNAHTHEALAPPVIASGAAITSIIFTQDGKTLIAGDSEGVLSWWDAQTHTRRSSLKTKATAVTTMIRSPHDKRVVVGTSEGEIAWMDIDSESITDFVLSQPSSIIGGAFTPDGKELVSVAQDGTLRWWDTVSRQSNGVPLQVSTAAIVGLAFSRNSKALYAIGEDGVAHQWDSPVLWIDVVCAKMVRNLSRDEWDQYLGAMRYTTQCPNLPAPLPRATRDADAIGLGIAALESIP